jgi:hypothetical protein
MHSKTGEEYFPKIFPPNIQQNTLAVRGMKGLQSDQHSLTGRDMMKTLFTITLVVELIFGIGFMAVPETLANTFDVTLSDFGITLSRLFGSALLGFAVLLWFGRQSTQPDTHKAALACMFSYFLLSTVFYLIAQLSGLMNAMGWSAVGLHLILSIAFGYFLLKRS